MKLYFAAPLFTLAERRFNSELAAALDALGHETWLPQDNEPPHKDEEMAKKIFDKDVEGIDWADVVVANMDGPDPDSGTCWECGYAYMAGKPVITYRTDFRISGDIPGAPFNLMLSMSSTVLILPDKNLSDVADAIHQTLKELPGFKCA